jgi:hypothetical protein
MLSGGSTASASVICAATTEAEHEAPPGIGEVGVRVNVVAGEELSVNGTAVELHDRVNELVVALTLSLKLTVIVADGATPVASSAGVVELTVGATSAVEKLKE